MVFKGAETMRPVRFWEGKRVYLRPLELEDLERLVRWFTNPEVTQYLLGPRWPLNRLREEEWLRNLYRSNRDLVFALCLRENDRHIGNCGLHRISWIDRFAELGIAIGEPEYWGKGYGTEAAGLLLDYAFRVLNLNRVELHVFATNERAIRSYRKLGFQEEGRLRKRRYVRGTYVDEIVMSVLREEWG